MNFKDKCFIIQQLKNDECFAIMRNSGKVISARNIQELEKLVNDADEGGWITINGAHIEIGKGGDVVTAGKELKEKIAKGEDGLSEKKLATAKSNEKGTSRKSTNWGRRMGSNAKVTTGRFTSKVSSQHSGVPYTTKDGKKIISGSFSANDRKVVGASQKAQEAYDKAVANEPKITQDMIDISKQLGCHMDGLEFCIKTGSSVAGKIERKTADDIKEGRKPKADHEYVKDMGDLVRYTQLCPHNDIARNTEKTIEVLKQRGYQIDEVDNKYNNPSSNYKGVHINVTSPSGQKVELQIHSEESMKVKNELHPMYEEFRDVKTPQARKDELNAKMKALSATLPMPKGIENVKNYKR